MYIYFLTLKEPLDTGLFVISVVYTVKNFSFFCFSNKFKALTAWTVLTNVLNIFAIVYSIVIISSKLKEFDEINSYVYDDQNIPYLSEFPS